MLFALLLTNETFQASECFNIVATAWTATL